MNRISIIQSLIDKNNYKSYLEIGVQAGHVLTTIQCETKIGVDPDTGSAATIHKTSDDFFAENKAKFDIIFIDGLHHAEQVIKDIDNSLKVLKKGGTIVMHDCLPTTKRMQEIPLQEQAEWTGDVWKAFVAYRCLKDNLEMCVVDTDWGCGIIRVGKQDKLVLNTDAPTYEDFIKNKNEWMNVISVEQFKTKFL